MAGIGSRMVRAARLEPALYEEVEADRSATGQAFLVVALSSVAGGIGAVGGLGAQGVNGLILGVIGSLVSWFVWAFLIFLIGTKILATAETRSDIGELLRTLGFAASPGLLGILGVIPGLGTLALIVSGIWMLAAMVVAVRQALDYTSTWRALAVCAIGFFARFAIVGLILGLAGRA